MTTVDVIKAHVAAYFNVKLSWMESPRRWKLVSRPRQVAMYLVRRMLGLSFPAIGRAFGGRHHTTAMFAVRTLDKLVEKRGKTWRDVTAIEATFSVSVGP